MKCSEKPHKDISYNPCNLLLYHEHCKDASHYFMGSSWVNLVLLEWPLQLGVKPILDQEMFLGLQTQSTQIWKMYDSLNKCYHSNCIYLRMATTSSKENCCDRNPMCHIDDTISMWQRNLKCVSTHNCLPKTRCRLQQCCLEILFCENCIVLEMQKEFQQTIWEARADFQVQFFFTTLTWDAFWKRLCCLR